MGLFRVFRYEFLRNIKRRGYLLTSIGIPLLAIAVFYAFQAYNQLQIAHPSPTVNDNSTRQDSTLPVGIVDETAIHLVPSKVDGNLKIMASREEAQKAIDNNEISGYWVIGSDYLTNGTVDLFFNHTSLIGLNNGPVANLLVQSLILHSGNKIDSANAKLLTAPLTIRPQIVSDTAGTKAQTGENAAFAVVYVFALALLFSAFSTSGYLMQSVIEEKTSRMVEIMVSSVRPLDLLGGKTLAYGLLGLFQMILWGIAAIFIFNQIGAGTLATLGIIVDIHITAGQFAVLIVYYIFGYLLFGSVFAAIGALSTNMREGPQLATFITLPAVIPVYLITTFSTAPDGPLAVGLSLFPITAPLSMVMRDAIQEVPFIQIALSLALLILTTAVVIWIAGRVFRVNVLLAGQMPKLRDIPRLIFEKV